jgi:hypothetical protein
MKYLYALVAIAVLALSGCKPGGTAGGEYLGKWARTTDREQTLEISSNGANFLVRETQPGMRRLNGESKPTVRTFPAVIQNGTLAIQAPMAAALVIDQATGRLIAGSHEYERVQ